MATRTPAKTKPSVKKKPPAKQKPGSPTAGASYPLLFADAFAVTRYAPPAGRLKNRVTNTGTQQYWVRDDRVLVLDSDDVGTLYDADLAPPPGPSRAAAGPFAPYAGGVLIFHRGVLVRRDGATDYTIERSEPGAQIDLSLGDGPWVKQRQRQLQCFASHDGGVAVVSEADTVELGVLARDGVRMTVHVRVQLRTPRPPAFTVLPGRERHALCAFDPAARRACVSAVAPDGSVRSYELAALGLPVRSGDELWYLSADGTHARCADLDGNELEAVELPPEHRGHGALHASNGHVAYAPAHREALYDLRAKRLADRKLAAKERPMRAYVTRLEERLRPLFGAAHARAECIAVRFGAGKNPTFSRRLRTDGGDQGLLVHLAFGMLQRPEAFEALPAETPWVNLGLSYVSPPSLQGADVDDVRDALTRIDEAGLSVLHGLHALQDSFERFTTPYASDKLARPLSPEAAELLFYVAARLHERDETVPAMPLVEQWRAERLTPEQGAALLGPACAVNSTTGQDKHRYGLIVPIAYLAALAWGARAEPVFERILRGPASRFAGSNAGHFAKPRELARREG